MRSSESTCTYSHSDRATLAALLGRQRMRVPQGSTPVSSSNWQDTQLGDDDGGANGSSHLLGGLDTETDVAFRVSNDNDSLEPRTLTSTSLLLNGLDLYFEGI
jgi:hypothetical protein